MTTSSSALPDGEDCLDLDGGTTTVISSSPSLSFLPLVFRDDSSFMSTSWFFRLSLSTGCFPLGVLPGMARVYCVGVGFSETVRNPTRGRRWQGVAWPALLRRAGKRPSVAGRVRLWVLQAPKLSCCGSALVITAGELVATQRKVRKKPGSGVSANGVRTMLVSTPR